MAEPTLRDRIIKAFTVEPDTFRVLNAGALEVELWTEAEWRDEYAADLWAELSAMEADGLVQITDLRGLPAYSLISPSSKLNEGESAA